MDKQKFTYKVYDAKTRNFIYEEDFTSDNPFKDIAERMSKEDISHGSLYIVAENEDRQEAAYTIVKKSGTKFVKYEHCDFPLSYIDFDIEPRYLTCIDEVYNHYKYYEITFDKDNLRTNVRYGRIGADKNDTFGEREYDYPLSMYWVKYYEKLSKGYEDKNELKDFNNRQKKGTEYEPVKDKYSKSLIEFLIRKQKDYVESNYSTGAAFSMEAVKKSEKILEELKAYADSSFSNKQFKIRELFKELVTILPRRIADVSNYLNYITGLSSEALMEHIEQEEDLLNNFKDLYVKKENEAEEKADNKDILEANNLTATCTDYKDIHMIEDKLDKDMAAMKTVLAVKNKYTNDRYIACKKEKGIENRGCHLLWHGSRTENWWSIFKNGLTLNNNAIVTGKMFGQGLYFAPKAEKSMNYTSSSGSYWTGGNDKTGFMALYAVAMGKPYEIDHALSSYFTEKDLKHGCHSVWGKAGRHLRNDECIIYDERQCDIKFLLEVDREREKYLTPEFIKAARNIKLNQLKADKNGLRAYMSLRTPDSTFNRLNMDKNNKVEFIYTYDNTLTIKAYDKELKSSEKELKFNSYQTDYLKMIFKENFTSNDREFDMLLEEKQKEVQKPKTKVKKKEIEMSLLA